jgi:hypothetical protein
MPQIMVIADTPAGNGEPPIMFRERVSVDDFESQHFATQLVERLGWAVGDADELDRRSTGSAGRPGRFARAALEPARRAAARQRPVGATDLAPTADCEREPLA